MFTSVPPTFRDDLRVDRHHETGQGRALTHLRLGKDVKPLLDMPAYKDGVDIYYLHKQDKHLDDRGIDLKELSKYLCEKGVGVERDEWVTITDVKIDSDRVEIHLGGGGEGCGASKETWYYLKDGHRWLVRFLNGKVIKIQIF